MIHLKEWTGGLNLRQDAWKLPPNYLTTATNVVVKDGALVPLKALGSAEVTGLGAGTWAWIHKLGSTWLASTSVRFAIEWQGNRLYYVDGGTLKVTDGTTPANAGVAGPTAPCSAAGGAGTGITGTNLSYVITYLNPTYGMESYPSPASGTVSPTNDSVDLSSIPTSTGLYRKIYRTDASGTYRYVATISDDSTTTYSDTTPVSGLGDPILTEGFTTPPTLSGICVGTHRRMVGYWNGSDAYRSAQGMPAQVSRAGTKMDEDIVAGFGCDLGFVFLTAAKPYLLTGTGVPVTDTYLTPYNNNYGCSAAHSVCKTDKGFVWWSPKGLILFTPSGEFVELMAQHFDQADIDGYTASTIKCGYANGEVLVVTASATLRCDLTQGQPVWTTSDILPGAFYRAADGTLYCASGNDVKKWATGSAASMTIRTPEIANPNTNGRMHVRSARVRTDAAGNTYQWYASGSAHGSAPTAVRADGDDKVMAPQCLWHRAALQIAGTNAVREITIEATEVGGGS